jgi:predicted amidophosphoribosyltransferase
MVERLAPPPDLEEVVAVPAMSDSRRRTDHAADLLASAIAARLGLPFVSGRLAKVRATQRQSALPLARRADNVHGAFRARREVPQGILLVDDVATSGATARECARVLRRAGAKRIDVWCFARASKDDFFREVEGRGSGVNGSATSE